MRNVLVGICLSFSSFTMNSAHGQGLEVGKYNLDPGHSKIGFEVAHLVIATVDGRFTKYTADIKIADPIAKSTVSAEVDIASITTGDEKRDGHLKSPDFFDVSKFPKMTFKSKTFELNGKELNVSGDLKIRDITKEVKFTGKFAGMVKDPWGNQRAAVKLSTVVSRKEFGLKWNNLADAGPVVGDEVTIILNLEGVHQKKDAAH